ncbi:MAG: DNA-binding protein HU-beta [Candidatus Cloacimonadota bacterium]|nr:DNA-binding protein HU-beta [Candidatus Cloacimonadota bacterium]
MTELLCLQFNSVVISLTLIQTTIGGKMSRDELVKKIASDAGISQKVAGLALASVLEGITMTLKKGGKVSLVGFGSFSVAHRKARKGINPKTKAPLKIPARNVPVFKAGKNLKDAVKK